MRPRPVRADFHLHSCLSPCGSLEGSPAALVRRACEAGLDAVALTDHNTALHTPLFMRLCVEAGLHVLAGLEVTTAEELHVLCLFDRPDPALAMGNMIGKTLPRIPCRHDAFGDQAEVDADEEVIALHPWYLPAASSFTLTETTHWAREHGGIVIPSHIDRPACSLGSQLGRVPDLPFAALEIRDPHAAPLPGSERYPKVRFSDAHAPQFIGYRWTEFLLADFSVAAIAAALREGRYCCSTE